jgi:hypothetical protein
VRFVPYTELAGEPNVIVDGASTTNTLLTLSHWPGSRVAESLAADLSAEIVFRYLEQPDHHVDAQAVSNNHLDQDGLMGVWSMIEPELALAHKDLVNDVARAGDFGWSHTRDAARISIAIAAMRDAHPLSGDCARMHQELLPIVPDLLRNVNAYRDLWADEDEHITASDDAVERGAVTIEEYPELDLAIVTLPSITPRTYHRFTQQRRAGVHPMAVFNRTECSRVACLRGQHFSVELRYESVVQFVSRPILPRVDLGLLADRLNETESSGGKWYFEGIGGLTPSLLLGGADESSLSPTTFVDGLLGFLATAEPAWDPWAESGFR